MRGEPLNDCEIGKTMDKKTYLIPLIVLAILQTGTANAKPGNAEKLPQGQSNPVQPAEVRLRLEDITRVSFYKSGGFVATNRTATINIATMPEAEKEQIRKLIDNSGLLSAKDGRPSGACDAFNYSFEFSDASGKKRALNYDEVTLPKSASALAKFLDSKAVDQSKSRQ